MGTFERFTYWFEGDGDGVTVAWQPSKGKPKSVPSPDDLDRKLAAEWAEKRGHELERLGYRFAGTVLDSGKAG